MGLDSMPMHEVYPLLLGARESIRADINKLRSEWGENPTKRQRKTLEAMETKATEIECRIAAIETYILKKCVTRVHTS